MKGWGAGRAAALSLGFFDSLEGVAAATGTAEVKESAAEAAAGSLAPVDGEDTAAGSWVHF